MKQYCRIPGCNELMEGTNCDGQQASGASDVWRRLSKPGRLPDFCHRELAIVTSMALYRLPQYDAPQPTF